VTKRDFAGALRGGHHQRFAREILTLPGSAKAAAATSRHAQAEVRETFVGREEALERIDSYIGSDDLRPLGVFAEGGSGKSTLLAQAAETAGVRWPHATVVARFIGASASSVDGRLLLHGLCLQFARLLGQSEWNVPSDYVRLTTDFRERLAAAARRTPLLVFLDALDQLSEDHFARNLGWLPRRLPAGVRMVVSTRPGECLERLRGMGIRLLELGPMTLAEGDELLNRWLVGAGRTLQPSQRQRVMEGFAVRRRPLYLRLAFERACHRRSYDRVGRFPHDIPGMIQDLFAELGREENHGRTLPHHALGYLAASRFGLSEDELLDLLSADPLVMADFRTRARPEWLEGVDRLPVVIWSRLRVDLQPYLSERRDDQASLLTFYHRELQEVAERDYLAGREGPRRHAALAAFFRQRIRRSDPRGLQEFPTISPWHGAGANCDVL
jgi:NACHT domain- and WD repeat-containing protein